MKYNQYEFMTYKKSTHNIKKEIKLLKRISHSDWGGKDKK